MDSTMYVRKYISGLTSISRVWYRQTRPWILLQAYGFTESKWKQNLSLKELFIDDYANDVKIQQKGEPLITLGCHQ